MIFNRLYNVYALYAFPIFCYLVEKIKVKVLTDFYELIFKMLSESLSEFRRSGSGDFDPKTHFPCSHRGADIGERRPITEKNSEDASVSFRITN
jgi:hypothetical protein